MKKIITKNFFLNIITLIISLLIALLITNFLLINLSPKKIFPRSLAGSLPNILLTFYAKTYNEKNLDNYIALLGDSYAQGNGDAYLNGTEDYSIGHHLYNNNKNKNYLQFGRAGYGSISAVSNLIKIHKFSQDSFFIKDLKKPETIIFFFYEGNDLHSNIIEYKKFIRNNEKISNYVSRRIEKNTKLNTSDLLESNFPILFFFGEFYYDFKHLFKKIYEEKNFKEIKNLIISRIKKLFGYTIVLNAEKKDNKTWTNSIKNHSKINNIRPVEGAALHLTNEEILISLEIFFESILQIKFWSKIDKIYIVYLPSPISSYKWNEPIVFHRRNYYDGDKTTTNKKNSLNSLFIRNKIKEFTSSNNIKFLDSTNFILEKGKNTILHGPLDWHHFNYDGYKNVSSYLIESTKNEF